MKPPRVSVVMTAYNREQYVEEAIRSVLGQTFPDFELIVVDDGSTDGTAAIVGRLAAEDPRIRVITQSNQGIVRAANVGCAAARGEYLARFDSDDVCFPDRLARQVDFLDHHSSFAVVAGIAQVIDERGHPGGFLDYHADRSSLRGLMEQGCWIIQPAALMRRDAFEAAGGYRQGFAPAEDYDLWLRIADDHDLANLPDPPVIRYRVHATQASDRHKRQQAIGGLAARTATRMRRSTGRDPLDGVIELSPDVLARLGLGERDIEAAVVEVDLIRIGQGIRCDSAAGLEAREAALARMAAAHPWRWYGAQVDRMRRDVEIEIAVRRARLLLAAGDPLRAAGVVATAACRAQMIVPRLFAGMLRKAGLLPSYHRR